MTKDEAVATIVALVEERDHVTFVEIGRAVPGFNYQRGTHGHVVGQDKPKGCGLMVYWLMSDFGLDVYQAIKSKVAFAPTSIIVYLVDGGVPKLKPPDEFVPMVLRPVRATTFIAADGSNVAVPSEHWPRLRRWLGKDAVAAGRAKAKAFVAALP
jgi:hypothetical protein